MTDSNTMLSAFAELAPRYEETMDSELTALWGVDYRTFVSELLDRAPVREGDAVLDVATGTALIPRMSQDRVGCEGRVVGLDITPAMLAQARDRIAGSDPSSPIALVCGSAMTLPYGEGTFDVVVCGFGTHHMDVPQMLSEMKRVLKAGGRLLLADAAAPDLWRKFWFDPLLTALLPLSRLFIRNTRARAEADAIGNMRTAGEWSMALSSVGFAEITVTEHRARRIWYPLALTMRAVVAAI